MKFHTETLLQNKNYFKFITEYNIRQFSTLFSTKYNIFHTGKYVKYHKLPLTKR